MPRVESSDIIWENVLRPNFATKALRKATSMLMIFILLIAAIGVIVYAKDTLSKSPPAVACPNTVKDATTNPDPMLECKAIWDLAAEDAINNATSEARRSVDMFINNIVSYEDCGDFIVKADWARPKDPSAYGSYNTPATGSVWDGRLIDARFGDLALGTRRRNPTPRSSVNADKGERDEKADDPGSGESRRQTTRSRARWLRRVRAWYAEASVVIVGQVGSLHAGPATSCEL